MASGSKPYLFRVSHEYVADPESVERGHKVWSMYLAKRLRRELSNGATRKAKNLSGWTKQL